MENRNAIFKYLEPNNLQDGLNENIPFNHEDLCIAVDIQVEAADRYSCGLNDGAYTIMGKRPGRTISFLQGTDGMLTTSFTDISSFDREGNPNKETLGIKSIDIKYTSMYFPEVTIQFCDVRGSALMEAMEDDYVASLKEQERLRETGKHVDILTDGIVSQSSFFRALFMFPYPMFTMRVKGYYGKAVEYQLVVSEFQSHFNGENGSFDVTVNFIGYMYGPYTDIPFKYLMLAPYINTEYWRSQVNNGTYVMDSEGDKTSPMPTFVELTSSLNGYAKKVNQLLQHSDIVKRYNGGKRKVNTYKGLVDKIISLEQTFGERRYEYKKHTYINGKEENIPVFTLITQPEGIREGEKDRARHDRVLVREIYNILKEETELKTMAEYFRKIAGIVVKDGKESISHDEENWRLTTVYQLDSYGKWVASGPADIKETLENELYSRRVITESQPNNGIVRGYIFSGTKYKAELRSKIDTLNRELRDLEEQIKAQAKNEMVNVLGFYPSARNVTKMVFAHLDCFMDIFYKTTEQIGISQRSFQSLGINVSATDINRNAKLSSFVPPFPLLIDNERQTVYPTNLPGLNDKNMIELNLVKKMVATAEGELRLAAERGMGGSELPTLISDILNPENPYCRLNDNTSNLLGDIYTAYANRFLQRFGVQCDFNKEITDSDIRDFAEVEAYKAYKCFIGNKNLLNKLTGVKEETIHRIINELEDKADMHSPEYSGSEIIGVTDGMRKRGEYTWTHRKGVNVLVYNNIQTLVDFFKNDGDIENNTKFYPVKPGLTESLSDAPSVFKLRDSFNIGDIDGRYGTYNLQRKKGDDGVKNPFSGMCSSSYEEFYGKYIHTYPSNEYWKKIKGTAYSCRDELVNCIKNRDMDNYQLQHIPFYTPFGKGELFGNSFFLKQTDIHAQALLFLESMPLDYEAIFGRDNTVLEDVFIDNRPKIVMLLLGGLLYNKCINWVDAPTNHNGLFLIGDTTIVAGIGSKYAYQGELWINKLKNPVKETLIRYFLDWVRKNFSVLSSQLRFTSYYDKNFKKTIDILLNMRNQLSELPSLEKYRHTQQNEVMDEDGNVVETITAYYLCPNIAVAGKADDRCVEISEDAYNLIGVISNIDTKSRKGTGIFKDIVKSCLGQFNDYSIDFDTVYKIGIDDYAFTYNDKTLTGFGLDFLLDTVAYLTCGRLRQEENIAKYQLYRIDNGVSYLKSFATDDDCINYVNKYNSFAQVFTVDFKNLFKKDVSSLYYDNVKIMNDYLQASTANTITDSEYFMIKVEGSTSGTTREGRAVSDNYFSKGLSLFTENLKTMLSGDNINNNIEVDTYFDAPVKSTDLLLSTYLMLKSLYDKWLCNIPRANWTLSGTNSEFRRYKFLDTYFKDIGDSLLIDINSLQEAMDAMQGRGEGSGYSPSVYEFMDMLAKNAGCSLIATPAFFGAGEGVNYEDVFRPISYNEMTSTDFAPSAYLWVYAHTASNHLDEEDGDFDDDGIDLANSTDTGGASLPEDLFGENNLPAFGVSFGLQNQSIFKGFDIGMSNMQQTEYSMRASLAIADSYGKNAQVANFINQNLFQVYSNYAYGINIEMMGDVCVGPLMYFQLNGVPMFKGGYIIQQVSHHIAPEGMTTNFTGYRISKNKLPLLSDVVLMTNILDVITKADEEKVVSINRGDDHLYRQKYIYQAQAISATTLYRNNNGSVILNNQDVFNVPSDKIWGENGNGMPLQVKQYLTNLGLTCNQVIIGENNTHVGHMYVESYNKKGNDINIGLTYTETQDEKIKIDATYLLLDVLVNCEELHVGGLKNIKCQRDDNKSSIIVIITLDERGSSSENSLTSIALLDSRGKKYESQRIAKKNDLDSMEKLYNISREFVHTMTFAIMETAKETQKTSKTSDRVKSLCMQALEGWTLNGAAFGNKDTDGMLITEMTKRYGIGSGDKQHYRAG